MLSYICNKPLKIIQKFHHYRIVYKFSPSSYRKYFPSHACHKNCMQFKWIIIHVLIPLLMIDMQDIFIKSIFSTNIIMHAIIDLRECILCSTNDESDEWRCSTNKCFPWFPCYLNSQRTLSNLGNYFQWLQQIVKHQYLNNLITTSIEY